MHEEVVVQNSNNKELGKHLLVSLLILFLIGGTILMFGLGINNLHFPLLSVLIFFPVAGAALIAVLPRDKEELIKFSALLISIVEFILSIPLYVSFNKATHHMQFREEYLWIPQWGIKYSLGVDGISVLFILLSSLLTILCVTVSWKEINKKIKEFYAALLITHSAMIGVFMSLDIFLFYIFWEAMLIPMYLIIGVWGGPRRIYSAIKFFLYTFVGSVLMLVGILVLYFHTGTSDILTLMKTSYPYKMQLWLFWAFFAAFAVKVPMWPVHTWLPDAHTEAPTAGSVILAGILIKMGAYGFLRFNLPMFPEATVAMKPFMMILSVIAIIYGALICLVQKDLKRLIAYSSVSHMGFVTLGIFALNQQGIQGGILQMLNHGIITGALFLCVGIIYQRTHTREIAQYGGVASVMPAYSAFFMAFTLASIGLPGTNGFIGEFLILLGAFKSWKLMCVLAATALIIGAGYMLWLYQRVFFEKTNPAFLHHIHGYGDLNAREIATLMPLLVAVLWIGFYPNALLSFMDQSVRELISHVISAGAVK
ncbi:NADH-quinone oxidoreductase subunit M [Thermodesulfovibrio aggregans]|uniref:NADH-quinone oxidoreductase subunit M n=1 Tax=Thermodesulfovibrio aggregans TaxID=86166 RepID=A0A0U9IA56_9BACT|nr:NADH-quinone oxidoreductase subunit M [Thermodesulfovibrio aggregans]GAQ95014.1 NADH-quinone oxidoreductase subunit M [Thermodesulfovibrio aggregans]